MLQPKSVKSNTIKSAFVQFTTLVAIGLFVGCADDEPAEEPVAAEQNTEAEEGGDANEAATDNGFDNLDTSSPPEEPENVFEDAPKPMKETEKGGGIISGGAKPIQDGATFQDCSPIQKGKASPGFVAFGCTAKTADGQRANRVKGKWQIVDPSGKRVKIRNLQFPKGGQSPYDVTFEVPSGDATKSLSTVPK